MPLKYRVTTKEKENPIQGHTSLKGRVSHQSSCIHLSYIALKSEILKYSASEIAHKRKTEVVGCRISTCRSAHPSQTKKAVVKNMFRTATMVSSNSDLKSESWQLANRIAIENGSARWRKQLVNISLHSTCEALHAHIDFVLSRHRSLTSFPREIRNCVRKAGLDNMIRVVEVPPSNLKARLVKDRLYDSVCRRRQCIVCPNGKEGDCMVAGVVYLIKCTVCNGEYIGETGRPLGERVKEHLGTLRRCDISEPLGEHRLRCHDGATKEVAVAILSRESEISARKTVEALWIAERNPTINRKEERVEVTQE
ncbi:unnamed protein product, partial [Nippostrongylus brasiliensis]|uniref:GIY-YIG domain-containing protein n=1 Tax=Nippostrongylus brasiliensis TaxID=27835 RepID=A0A0N4XCY2_NIPBR